MKSRLFSFRNLLIIDGIIAVLKIIYTLFFQKEIVGYEDWSIAKNLVKYGDYSEIMTSGPSTMKLPVYPYFLSFFILFFGQFAVYACIIAQHILYFFIPLGMFKILTEFKLEKAGIFAGFLFLFSPAYLYYSFVLEVTNVFIPIFIVWILAAQNIYLKKSDNFLTSIVFGAVSSLLFLTQIVVVPIVAILFVYWVFRGKIPLKKVGLILGTAFILYSPWVIRNYVTFHQFIPTKSPFYHNIFVSFTSTSNVIPELKIFNENESSKIIHKRTFISELEMEKVFQNELRGKTSPRLFLIKAVQNAGLLWYVPAKYFYDNQLKIWLFRKGYVLIINLFTFFAFVYFYKKNKQIFYFFILLFIGFTFPYMMGHASNIRFKLDFEWLQLILLALYWTQLYDYKSKSSVEIEN